MPQSLRQNGARLYTMDILRQGADRCTTKLERRPDSFMVEGLLQNRKGAAQLQDVLWKACHDDDGLRRVGLGNRRRHLDTAPRHPHVQEHVSEAPTVQRDDGLATARSLVDLVAQL